MRTGRYSRIFLPWVFALLVVFLAPIGATAAEVPAGHAQGTVTTTDRDGSVMVREASIWTTPTGEYLVTVSDDYLVDEVYYDGQGKQFATITDAQGFVSSFTEDGSRHYLIHGLDTAEVTETVQGIPTSWRLDQNNGVSVVVELTHEEVKVSAAESAIAGRKTARSASRLAAADLVDDLQFIKASGGHATTMWQYMVTPFGSCVRAYNYRNNSSGYFVASSTSKNLTTCKYVGTSLWASKMAGGGSCGAPWVAASGTSYSHAEKSVTNKFPLAGPPSNRMCSNHWAYSYDWILVLPYAGYNASIVG
ncbi:MAG: hypothetical protein GY720_23725 [bacterium]|nr:hypothetical protein [bacterium]